MKTKNYTCYSKQARERGVMGVFHRVAQPVTATSKALAEEIFRNGYEAHHLVIEEEG